MKPMEILFDNDNDTGLGISRQEMARRITEAMPDADMKLYDLTGDGSHYQLEVTSSHFANKSMIQQHRLIYGLFKAELGGALHALALKTQSK